jgi:hypothetical protein
MCKSEVGAVVAERTGSQLKYCQSDNDGSITIRVSTTAGNMEGLQQHLRKDFPLCDIEVKASGLTGELMATLTVPPHVEEMKRAIAMARKRPLLGLVESAGIALILTSIVLYVNVMVRVGFEGA